MNKYPHKNTPTGLEIAVTGMAGRFPGARDIYEFWNNLANGVESVTFFSDKELQEAGVVPGTLNSPNYVKARPMMEDIDCFDAEFFAYTPRAAETLDPQMRIFYECAWSALEDAAYVPDSYRGGIGLYAGAAGNPLWEGLSILSGSDSVSEQFDQWHLIDKDFLSTRVSYELDLKGPSLTLYTTCSTSLVAIHTACRALLAGECKTALAGGVSATMLTKSGYYFQKDMIASSDGHCRAFDAQASGTLFGDGVGVVVLKRLKNAVEDGDNIYAVIKGSSINNDGKRKVGFTAPSIAGQSDVIRTALRMARVETESITYVETHGTATTMGDPVEIEGLKLAFKTDRKQFCAIGSVKSNVGHLNVAAGIAGFIKTVLALKHRQIPPSLHFKTPNPKIDFQNSPFYVNTELIEWRNEKHPLRAGVSSFGIGGTNAHLVLEEWAPPPDCKKETGHNGREYKLLLLSAKTPSALDKMTGNLLDYLKDNFISPIGPIRPIGPINPLLADIAYTLQVGRKAFPHRRMAVCRDVNEAVEVLSSTGNGKMHTFHSSGNNKPVIFMFPGLGSQYVNMGLGLYETEPIFRQEMDRCFEILKPMLEYDIKEILYPAIEAAAEETVTPTGSNEMNRIEIAQAAVFIIEYALAKLIMMWGIKPWSMIGYSFGEYAAACLSGVVSLEDTLTLIVNRGRLIAGLSPGSMLSVPLPAAEVKPLLKDNLSIAIDNGPSCIVSGPVEAVNALEHELKRKKYLCMRVPNSYAIHSTSMEPILKEFEKYLGRVKLNPPQIPYISNVTGTWITDAELTDPAYWARHLKETVQFARGIKELTEIENAVFIEVGPGRDLVALMGRYIDENADRRLFNLVRPVTKKVSDVYYLLNKIGRLWLYDVRMDWSEFYPGESRHRVPLPTYPFKRERYRVNEKLSATAPEALKEKVFKNPLPGIENWCYLPSWKRSAPVTPGRKVPDLKSNWLVFLNRLNHGKRLLEQLVEKHHKVVVVKTGEDFRKEEKNNSPLTYIINPGESRHYDALFNELQTLDALPHKIIHCWNVTEGKKNTVTGESFDAALFTGFFSLLYMVKAIEKQGFSQNVHITLLSNQLQDVVGAEPLCPAKVPVLGLLKSIPQEHPGLRCTGIDIDLPEPGSPEETAQIELLMDQLESDPGDTVVAFRNSQKWVQIFDPLHLEAPKEEEVGTRLRKQGVYLVTGGLGTIGLIFSELLVKHVGARLILTGRSTFPAGEEWNRYLDTHDPSDPTALKIKKLQKLEDMGGKILYLKADAANLDEMQAVVSQAENTFGTINGVIHAAGILGGDFMQPIRELSEENCRLHFHPKVYGSMVLEEIFKNRELDFCWMLSSISCVLGGLGFGAYSSANLFMDLLVKKHNRSKHRGSPWFSLNWDGMDQQKSTALFERFFALEKIDQVVVSRGGDLQKKINLWIKLESTTEKKHPDNKEPSSQNLKARPNLMSPYLAPRNPIETTIAGIWQRLFGFGRIGVRDDFFELGGDSLKAINAISKMQKILNVEVPITEFFHRLTIEKIAEYVTGADRNVYSAVTPVEKKEYYPLSSSQRRLYVLHRLKKEDIAYNEPLLLRVEGNLEPGKLENTFKGLIKRHEGFRTSFEVIEGEPVQRIHESDGIAFAIEYPGLAAADAADFIRPFDLSQTPLLRVGLINLEKEVHILMVDMPHIVTDGISHAILLEDFMSLYKADQLPGLVIQYKDFAEWQPFFLESAVIKKQEEFWLEQFKDGVSVLNLPTDHVRPQIHDFEGNRLKFQIGKKETRALREIARQRETTLYMVLVALANTWFSKLSGQEDIIVGTPIAGRRHADLEKIVGMFVNTLALRNFPRGELTFDEFLEDVEKRTLNAFDNQDYLFEELVGKTAVNRDVSRNPLFDVMFALHNIENPYVEIPGLKLKGLEYKKGTVLFDLILQVFEVEEQLLCSVQYSTKLFEMETIERFTVFFKGILSTVIDFPGTKLSELEIISEEEKKRVLLDFNNTNTDYPSDKTIHKLFEEQVEKRGDVVAAAGMGPFVTYRNLKKRSGLLAQRLLSRGVTPGSIVGIMVPRSVEMLTGILAILEAGGAYLPISPGYPAQRIHYMLKDGNVNIVLTQPPFAGKIGPGFDQIDPADTGDIDLNVHKKAAPVISPAHPAYIMYTSGSTGKPKGVMVEHGNVVPLVKEPGYIHLTEGDTLLLTGALVFDLTTFEIWGALLNGVTLYLVDDDSILDTARLAKTVVKYKISVLHLIPQLFNHAAAHNIELFAGLDYLLVGGDLVRPTYVNRVREKYKHLKILHMYGPTENTTFSTSLRIEKNYDSRIPIGKPINNSSVTIRDKYGKLLPVGMVGELYTGGAGVARGYLNNPRLTSDRFNRSYKSYRSYKTGDLARWLPDGTIEFLGRIDHQVKLRGQRIELGEIESLLLKDEKIKEAIVTAVDDGNGDQNYLCAYIVSDHELNVSRLRASLARELPDYMIPSYFEQVEKIPLTSNGKVDKKALLELEKIRLKTDAVYVAPGNEKEILMAELCKEVFKVDKIGINDNFFSIGATSFNLIQLNGKLQEVFQKEISVLTLFEYPTIASFLDHLKSETTDLMESREETEWRNSMSRSKNKFKSIRNRRIKGEKNENG